MARSVKTFFPESQIDNLEVVAKIRGLSFSWAIVKAIELGLNQIKEMGVDELKQLKEGCENDN